MSREADTSRYGSPMFIIRDVLTHEPLAERKDAQDAQRVAIYWLSGYPGGLEVVREDGTVVGTATVTQAG